MRNPHHLVRHRSGVWHFRMRVPLALHAALGLKVIKRSLGTCEVLQARATAYVLGLRYAAAFAVAKGAAMPKPPPPSIADILANVGNGRAHEWTLERDPLTGMVTKMATDGSAQDNAAAIEALKVVFASPLPPARGQAAATAAAPAVPAGLTPMALGKAADAYAATLVGQFPKKTITQKKKAVMAFAQYKGVKVPLHEVSRTDVSQWFASLRAMGLTTFTMKNKQAFLIAFFAWAQGAGHYSPGETNNPAPRHVQGGKNEKRQRRKFGFKALTPEQVRTLYSAEALRTLNTQTRWGAVIGLYTGARVSEVGQLALDDFIEEDGVWAVRITDEGAGQSVKNAASVRTIPVHPDLIRVGLLERVAALRAEGRTQLFPRAKAGSVNGMGNWLSKSYARHLAAFNVTADVGKVGFHSLRKTVVRALKDAGVREEARKEYVGHRTSGEHHEVYGKTFSPSSLLRGVADGAFRTAGVEVLTYGLDLHAVREALAAPEPPRKKRKQRTT